MIWLGSDHHQPGLRVRLFGAPRPEGLKEEGYEVVLITQNRHDHDGPGEADRTYVEPSPRRPWRSSSPRERPDALLPTLGGQDGVNTAVAVADMGDPGQYGVR
jgi:carbamoyl-phosphate synthase large subunit